MYLNSVKNRTFNAKTRRSNTVLTRILMIFKSLIKLLKKRKKPEIGLITGFLWRRRRDSNPRAREGKRISSAPRYDHFDTSPDMSNTVKTLESQKILKKQNVRTAC